MNMNKIGYRQPLPGDLVCCLHNKMLYATVDVHRSGRWFRGGKIIKYEKTPFEIILCSINNDNNCALYLVSPDAIGWTYLFDYEIVFIEKL